MPKPIAVIFTGGTICCLSDKNGTRHSHTEQTGYLLTEHYRQTHDDAQAFCVHMPMNTLSENMKPAHWDMLLDALLAISCDEVSGVMIAHGTDSLAETAAMLSVALVGYPLPVVLVSAHSPLDAEHTNGHRNFAEAVATIHRGLPCGVWVVYENLDGVAYLHHGARLRPCANESQEFFSRDMQPCHAADLSRLVPQPWQMPLPMHHMKPFADAESVLLLRPYIGQRYDMFSLEGVGAVVHGTYHSETANSHDDSPYSVRYLLQTTKARGIPCFLAPCHAAAQQYSSSQDLVMAGITPLTAASAQLAYGAAMVGIARGFRGDVLREWVVEICQRFAR